MRQFCERFLRRIMENHFRDLTPRREMQKQSLQHAVADSGIDNSYEAHFQEPSGTRRGARDFVTARSIAPPSSMSHGCDGTFNCGAPRGRAGRPVPAVTSLPHSSSLPPCELGPFSLSNFIGFWGDAFKGALLLGHFTTIWVTNSCAFPA